MQTGLSFLFVLYILIVSRKCLSWHQISRMDKSFLYYLLSLFPLPFVAQAEASRCGIGSHISVHPSVIIATTLVVYALSQYRHQTWFLMH